MNWLQELCFRFTLWLNDSAPWWIYLPVQALLGAVLGVVALGFAVGIVLEAVFILQNCLWLVPVAAGLGAAWRCRWHLVGLAFTPIALLVEAVQ